MEAKDYLPSFPPLQKHTIQLNLSPFAKLNLIIVIRLICGKNQASDSQTNLVRIGHLVIIRVVTTHNLGFCLSNFNTISPEDATVLSLFFLSASLTFAQVTEVQPEEIQTGEGQSAKALQISGNLNIRLQSSQELLYRGLFIEEEKSTRVQFQRSYRVETRALILDSDKNNFKVACLTVLKQRSNPAPFPPVSSDPPATSIRLETFICSSNGKVMNGSNLGQIPLEGPPTIEWGGIIELPLIKKSTWETTEEGRPICVWTVAGVEMSQGVKCLKLIGIQQTDDWVKTRADRQAWKRVDTVWLNTQLGVAQKLERTIEIKDPAHNEASHKSTMRYELETSLVYPGQLFEDRKKEIRLAQNFRDSANGYSQDIGKYTNQTKALIKQIKAQLELMSQTPYRDAITHTTKRLEATLKGENTGPVIVPVSATSLQVAKLGLKAPDFIAQNMLKQESVRLARMEGKTILMVFYNPKSPLSPEILEFTKAMQLKYGESVTVLGMSVLEDNDLVKKQAETYKINFPVLNGSGLRTSYGLESTPKVLVLDAKGIVRMNLLGWGEETQSEINAELQKVMD